MEIPLEPSPAFTESLPQLLGRRELCKEAKVKAAAEFLTGDWQYVPRQHRTGVRALGRAGLIQRRYANRQDSKHTLRVQARKSVV